MQVGEATIPFRSEVKRHRLTAPHTAYLRVAEGCNHACTFCAIPGFRYHTVQCLVLYSSLAPIFPGNQSV